MKKVLMICFGDMYNYSGYRNRIFNESEQISKIPKEKLKLDLLIIDRENRDNRNYESLKDFEDVSNIYQMNVEKYSFFAFVKIINFALKIIRGKQYNFVHSQSFLAGMLSLFVPRKYIENGFIYDIHGVIKEEKLMGRKTPNKIILAKIIKLIESKIIKKSNKVILVTNKMIDYLKVNYNISDEKSVYIIPCLFNEKNFYFSKEIRNEYRGKLKVNDRFVVVYSGSFNNWSKPEYILDEYLRLKNLINKDTFLLILTNQTEQINFIISNYLHGSEYLITTVNTKEVFKYLNASDLGLLIRGNHPVNWYAFPTKFGEYLGTGLPVFASENIGHIDSIKKEIKLPTNSTLENWLMHYINKKSEFRNYYKNYAFNNLSWNSSNKQFVNIYEVN